MHGHEIQGKWIDFEIAYNHLAQIDVEQYDFIFQDQRIGLMGSTGDADGRHLHWQIQLDDKLINPVCNSTWGNRVIEKL